MQPVPPWTVELTSAQRSLIQYAIVIAAFALAAMLTRLWSARGEVTDRYRPAVHAGIGAVLSAFLSYVLLIIEVRAGYTQRGDRWVPNADAVGTWSARFMDWTVSVPLLVVAVVAVSGLTGAAAWRAKTVGMGAAVGMVVLGFLGGVVVDDGRSFAALLGFGLASSACFAVLYVVIIRVVLRSLPLVPAAARPSLRAAMVVLVVTWFAYPIVFALQGFAGSGAITTASHLVLTVADLSAKVLFGLLVLRVARIRSATDVIAGEDTHPEGIWIDQRRQSDGVLPGPGDPDSRGLR